MTRARAALARLASAREEEVQALLWSSALCFLVFAAWYVLRPLREEMGIAGGVKNLAWMYTANLAGMFLLSPLFSGLVSRFSRRRFIPVAYHFFAANLVLFFVSFNFVEGEARVLLARVFYVWTSLFSLFLVSVFWAYMADVYRSEQAKRLFGFISAGGTLGGVAGSGLTALAVGAFGSVRLLLVAVLFVEAGLVVFARLERIVAGRAVETAPGAGTASGSAPDPAAGAVPAARPGARESGARRRDEGLHRTGAWGGLTLVMGSGYLLVLCGYILLFTTTSTFAYMEQARIVQAASASPEARTAIFARIDFLVNVVSFLAQGLLTARLMRVLGVGATLAILPVLTLLGFGLLWAAPGVAILTAFQVLRRSADYGAAKPAREVLYTVLTPEEKYKAKSFIDTFVYRVGDTSSAWIYKALTAGGDPAARVIGAMLPFAAAWVAIGLWLGRRQRVLAGERGAAGTAVVPA